jgi:hypothetical protein
MRSIPDDDCRRRAGDQQGSDHGAGPRLEDFPLRLAQIINEFVESCKVDFMLLCDQKCCSNLKFVCSIPLPFGP